MDEAFDLSQGIVKCPSCGDEYTHHRRTTVYTVQGGEVGPTLTTRVDQMGGASIEVDGEQNNPSSRRGAVVLHFECESQCKFDIQFIQHKGMTQVISKVIDSPVKDA